MRVKLKVFQTALSEGRMAFLQMCLNPIALKHWEHCKRVWPSHSPVVDSYHTDAHTHIFSHEILENRTLFGLEITHHGLGRHHRSSPWEEVGWEGRKQDTLSQEGRTPDFLPSLPLKLSPCWSHQPGAMLAIPSRAENPASAFRIPPDAGLSSWCSRRDPAAVQSRWLQQLAAALHSVEAEVSSWDDLIWSLDDGAGEAEWNR